MNNIQSLGNSNIDYRTSKNLTSLQNPMVISSPENGDKVTISDAGSIQQKLEAIKAKPAVERTDEDTKFLLKNDFKFAEIASKNAESRTADDVDYIQKAGGFVNTMSYLSPKEKALYDELVASGNTEALNGMKLIALSRALGGNNQTTLPNGKTFNPNTTEITSDNIQNLFKKIFVDDGTGQSNRSFDALAAYLDQRKQA